MGLKSIFGKLFGSADTEELIEENRPNINPSELGEKRDIAGEYDSLGKDAIIVKELTDVKALLDRLIILDEGVRGMNLNQLKVIFDFCRDCSVRNSQQYGLLETMVKEGIKSLENMQTDAYQARESISGTIRRLEQAMIVLKTERYRIFRILEALCQVYNEVEGVRLERADAVEKVRAQLEQINYANGFAARAEKVVIDALHVAASDRLGTIELIRNVSPQLVNLVEQVVNLKVDVVIRGSQVFDDFSQQLDSLDAAAELLKIPPNIGNQLGAVRTLLVEGVYLDSDENLTELGSVDRCLSDIFAKVDGIVNTIPNESECSSEKNADRGRKRKNWREKKYRF